MKQFLSWYEFKIVIELSLLTTMSLDKVIGGLKPKIRSRILSDEELRLCRASQWRMESE